MGAQVVKEVATKTNDVAGDGTTTATVLAQAIDVYKRQDKAKTHERMKKGVMEEVKQIFRPEFLNRIDETIVFAVLTKEEVKKIAKLFMDELRARLLSEHQITLKITSGAMDLLADKGYDENYGARPLRRIIQNEIEDVLADKILEGTLTNGQTMTIGKKDKKLTFSVKEN